MCTILGLVYKILPHVILFLFSHALSERTGVQEMREEAKRWKGAGFWKAWYKQANCKNSHKQEVRQKCDMPVRLEVRVAQTTKFTKMSLAIFFSIKKKVTHHFKNFNELH